MLCFGKISGGKTMINQLPTLILNIQSNKLIKEITSMPIPVERISSILKNELIINIIPIIIPKIRYFFIFYLHFNFISIKKERIFGDISQIERIIIYSGKSLQNLEFIIVRVYQQSGRLPVLCHLLATVPNPCFYITKYTNNPHKATERKPTIFVSPGIYSPTTINPIITTANKYSFDAIAYNSGNKLPNSHMPVAKIKITIGIAYIPVNLIISDKIFNLNLTCSLAS